MKLSDTIRSVLTCKGWGVFSIGPRTTVYDAVQTMSDKDIGAVVIAESEVEPKRMLGIFSERDYARKIILLGRSSKDTLVGEVMSFPATTVTPDETVEFCLRMMTTYRLRHLVVVENSRLVGMVSIGDLVNWIISAQEEMIGQLHSYISGNYPG
jgi:CBS domain-containing protein